jgi:pyridoxal phosphate enzyme (YggS family)
VKQRLSLGQRHNEVRARIERAARASGRDPERVTLIAVTKTVEAGRVLEAIQLGIKDLGENRVQEAAAKIQAVGRHAARWHSIGHLQRNKAGRAVELFDRIHGIDDLALASALSRHAVARERNLPVLIEVNVSGESTKFGVAPEAARELVEAVAGLPGLALDGFMTVGARVERPEEARAAFARLRELRDRAEGWIGRGLPELSMGMSDDFEPAVMEGATWVRIGTALFGPRA